MVIDRSGINLNAYATLGESLGTGSTFYVGKADINTLQFRTISQRGNGINIIEDGNNLIVSGGTVDMSWGGILGTLSNQTDLQNVLDLKLESSIFNTYTGDTETVLNTNQPFIDAALTGVTNLGTGTTIGSTSGRNVTSKSLSVIGGLTLSDDSDNVILSDIIENRITVAKSGGQFTSIQDAIDHAVVTYPARTLNTPVIIIVDSGEYREQIHSYENILIISSAAAYDTGQGQAKVTIIMSGDTAVNYPLRTEVGDVYYMVGISIYTDVVDGVLGYLPNGTFKNCSTRYGHFIENIEFTNTQFKDCKFNSNTYGGFNIVSAVAASSSVIKLDRCTHFGTPTFKSTHPANVGFIGTTWSEFKGSFDIGGDWGIQGFQTRVHAVAVRNIFDTTSEVKFEGGYMVSGIHFVSAPGSLLIHGVSFNAIADNQIPVDEADITADVVVEGDILDNAMFNGYSSNIHMDNPDKFVGHEVKDSYISLKAALDSISDNDVDKRYTIMVSAGKFLEDNPLQGKEYVTIKSVGDYQTTRIEAANPNEDLIIMAKFFIIEGFAFWGVSGATKYAINQSVSGLTSVTRCYFAECSNGILLNHSDGSMTVNDCGIYNLTFATLIGIHNKAGVLNINTYTGALGNITTLVEITGIAATATINNIISTLTTVTNGISVKDLANVDISGARLVGMGTGLECDGGSRTDIKNSRIENASVDGVRINDVGTNTNLNVLSTTIEGSAGFDTNILSNTALLTGFAKTSLDKFNFVTGARFYGTVIDVKEDDEGFNVLGELHVGIPERGTESVFGQGDSYTRGMKVYTFDGITTVDVSTEARSPSSSTFTFPNTDSGTAIYVASTLENDVDKLKYHGIKTKLDTALVVGGGEVQAQYYNGATWVQFNTMEVESAGRYFSHANKIFEQLDTPSHHIRYDMMLNNDGWTKNDPVAYGTDLFWSRFIITTGITTAPIFEQFKLHTSRFEINIDGFIEYFGNARPVGILPWQFGVLEKAGGAGDDRDLFLSDTLDVGMKKNRFDTAKLARVGFNSVLPMDLDTSSPITFSWQIIAEAAGGQDVDWILSWGYSKDGDSVYPTNVLAPTTAPSQQIYEVSLPAPTVNTAKWYSHTLDVSDMVSRRDGGYPDTIWFTISRDGVTDAYGGTITIINISANYIKWCEGGHA